VMKVIMVSTIMTNPPPSDLCLVFGAGSLANSPYELTSKRRGRRGRIPKVDNMLRGLSDALITRYLNVVTTGRRAAADAKK
jgi:hypothetical protein